MQGLHECQGLVDLSHHYIGEVDVKEADAQVDGLDIQVKLRIFELAVFFALRVQAKRDAARVNQLGNRDVGLEMDVKGKGSWGRGGVGGLIKHGDHRDQEVTNVELHAVEVILASEVHHFHIAEI